MQRYLLKICSIKKIHLSFYKRTWLHLKRITDDKVTDISIKEKEWGCSIFTKNKYNILCKTWKKNHWDTRIDEKSLIYT